MAESPQPGATAAPEEPTRPEEIRQPGYSIPESSSMGAVQPAMNEYNEAAQAHSQKQWEAKQQPDEKQSEEKLSPEELKAEARAVAQEILGRQGPEEGQQQKQAELGGD